MVNQWHNERERDTEVYTEPQIEAIADFCDLEIVSQTATHFQAYCPFHHNTDTPAFVLDKELGLWTCFNPSCEGNSGGNLHSLLRSLKGLNYFEAARVIKKFELETHGSISERLNYIKSKAPEFVQFPEEPVKRMAEEFWTDLRPQAYMNHRGFEEETLKYFEVGYSKKRDMVIVPMHDPNGMLVGFIGRSIEGKVFKNSTNLPKSKTAWNYHRAKKHGDTVIIVESSFDAMRVHQAGYPNVVALLGSGVSPQFLEQLNRTFSTVIIMTDFDKKWYPPNCSRCKHLYECVGHRPGRDFGWKIVNGLIGKTVKWAAYDDTCVYPHGAKDVGDLTDDEIRQCLTNAVSHFTYSRWNIENEEVAV